MPLYLVCWSWQISDQENRSCATIPHFAKLSKKGFVLLSVTCIIPLSCTLKHEWRQPQFKRPETPISTLKLHQSVCFSDLISHDKKCFCMTMTVIFDVSIRTLFISQSNLLQPCLLCTSVSTVANRFGCFTAQPTQDYNKYTPRFHSDNTDFLFTQKSTLYGLFAFTRYRRLSQGSNTVMNNP